MKFHEKFSRWIFTDTEETDETVKKARLNETIQEKASLRENRVKELETIQLLATQRTATMTIKTGGNNVNTH